MTLAAPPQLGPRPFLTRHALQRCREMGVERAEVVHALRSYVARYPSPAHYGKGRFVSVAGRLAVVHTATLLVITVLWNGKTGRDIAC
jgi:hypothetical protein